MADLGAFFGNPNIQRQGARARALAGQRDVNTLPDPLTYAVMQGLLGTRPDEMGFSVLNPDYEKIKKVAEPAFALGLLGQAAPVLAPLTKGLPVGASILDVGKSASKSIVREGNPIQSAVVLIGDKIFTGRTHTEAFNRAIYEGVVRKEGGKFIYPKNAEVNSDLFMTKDGQIIDRIQASKMFDIGASETAIKEGLMQNKPASSMTVDSYIKQAEKLKKQKKSAPRQEALDTAQRNAALPIEKGGLGLPKDNTPEMRAEAMGFDVDAYHGTNTPDILAFDPSLVGKQSGGNLKASFFADRPSAANYYINETPENVVIKPQYAEEYNKIYSKFTNDEAKAIEKFNETYDKNIRSTVQIPWDEANPEVLALKNQARKSADDYFAKYFDEDIVQNPKYFDKNPEGLVYPVKLNTKGLMDYDAGGATWTPYQDQRIKSLLAQEGRTLEDVGGVNISNSYDADVGQKIGVYGIADPSRIRSRFAAFDPMRRNEPDLLAGVLPLGLLTDEDQRNKLYEMLPSLLGQ